MNKFNQLVLVVHALCLLMSAISLSYLITPDGGWLHKSLAGFFIGTYGLTGKEVVKLLGYSLWKRALPTFDEKPFLNAAVFVALILFAGAGLLAWITSWEASTGVYFGLAVMSAVLLSDYGLVPLFKEWHPTSRVEDVKP